MLELALPWLLLLLPAPWLIYRLLPPHRETVGALRIPFFEQVIERTGAEARSGAVVRRRLRLQVATAAIVWVLLVLALARPEWVGEPITRTEAARDVMLAIDLSGSMDTVDFPNAAGEAVDRLSGVKQVVSEFVAARESDRIAVIVFGDRAYLQLPFTRDVRTAGKLVDLMQVGMAGPRTAIGDAIGLAIKSFEESEVEERLLILLTDGHDTASRMKPINAAGIAKSSGVVIYTIGVGDPDATGEDRVDFEALEAISGATGGAFFSASDETSLREVYERIDELAAADVMTTSWRPREPLSHWPAGAAVLVVLAFYTGMLLTGGGRRLRRA